MVGMQIFVTVLISVLILIGEHYWPWYIMLGRSLRLTERYILGVLAIVLPLSGLMIVWQLWMVLLVIWLVVFSSGLTTVVMFQLDQSWDHRDRAELAEAAEKVLKDGTLSSD